MGKLSEIEIIEASRDLQNKTDKWLKKIEEWKTEWKRQFDILVGDSDAPFIPDKEKIEKHLRLFNEMTGWFEEQLKQLENVIDQSVPCKEHKKRKRKGKDIIYYSNRFADARYDFSIPEWRILIRIIEHMGKYIYYQSQEGEKGCYLIDKEVFENNTDTIKIPLSSLRSNEKDKNYTQIKQALRDLQKRTIEYEDTEKKEWVNISILIKSKIDKRDVTLQMNREAIEFLWNFSKGFRRLKHVDPTMIFSLKSVYSIHLFMFVAEMDITRDFLIEKFRHKLKLENKYKKTRELLSRVIDPAKRELDSKSPYSFEYELKSENERKQTGGRKKITGIKIIPTHHPEHSDPKLAISEKKKELPDIDREIVECLIYLGFTRQELGYGQYRSLLLGLNKWKRRGKEILTNYREKYIGKKTEGMMDEERKAYVFKSLKNELEECEKNPSAYVNRQEKMREALIEKSKKIAERIDTNENVRLSYVMGGNRSTISQPVLVSERIAERKSEIEETKDKPVTEKEKEKERIRNFLEKDYLDFSGDELDKVCDYVSTNGGTALLMKVMRECENDKEKMREHFWELIK